MSFWGPKLNKKIVKNGQFLVKNKFRIVVIPSSPLTLSDASVGYLFSNRKDVKCIFVNLSLNAF